METGWIQDLLNWLSANPGWGWTIVFLVAFVESLALIGLLLPGLMILFGVGSLVGLGVMQMLPMWLAASAGAFLGDSLSYWLGRRYRERLLDIWPFSRYPNVMSRGHEFFYKHGEKSVFVGRFIGPLRPIIPAVGGILGMTPTRFLVADFAACIAWAPAFLLPGLFFGATLEVASDYAGRLAIVLVVVLLVLWAAWWLLRIAYIVLAGRSARLLRHGINWTRRNRVLGRIAGPVLDPSKPEILSVTMLGVLLVMLFWAVIVLLFMGPFAAQPESLDQKVAAFALSLRNDLADPAMVGINQLARWQVTVLAAVALLLWLLGAGRINAASHWLVAIGGGILIQSLLTWGLRATPQVSAAGHESFPGPSSAMALTAVVLSFFAVMVAREFKRHHRQWPYLASGLLLVLLFVARIYLGLEWFSGALLGLLIGLAWVSVVGIAYRQRRKEPFSGAVAANIFYAALLFLFVWQVSKNVDEDVSRLQIPITVQKMDRDDWWSGQWNLLASARTTRNPAAARQFDLQLALPLEQIETMLVSQGWETVDAPDWRWLIRSLNPDPDESNLPLIAHSFEGRSEALLMRHETAVEGRLLSIRVWDSGVRLSPGNTEVYLALISEEQLVQRFGLFSYWRSDSALKSGVGGLAKMFPGTEHFETVNGPVLIR